MMGSGDILYVRLRSRLAHNQRLPQGPGNRGHTHMASRVIPTWLSPRSLAASHPEPSL